MKKKQNSKQMFNEEKQKVKEIEREIIENINTAKKTTIETRLYKMIEYGCSRVDYYENQRHKLLQIGLALLATSAALLAVLARLNIGFNSIPNIFLWLFAISPLGTGLYIVFLFNKSFNNVYPYRKIADIRSWYFAYNFPHGLEDNLSKDNKKAKRQVNDITQAFAKFIERWKELAEQPKGFLKEDLQQVFILQLLQRYRNQQVRFMSKILWLGLLISVILLIITIIASFLFGAPIPNQKTEPVENWRGLKTPTSGQNIQFIENIKINHSNDESKK